jgi:WD40 repeat protein
MSPRLAPNGLVVAFIAPGGQDGRPPQIQAIGTEGNSLPIPLTDSPYDKRELAWSPNGEWLAYTEDVTGCGVLMLMDYQKRRSIPLTTPEDGCVEHLAWPPDHNYILFDMTDKISSSTYIAHVLSDEQGVELWQWDTGIEDVSASSLTWYTDTNDLQHMLYLSEGRVWQVSADEDKSEPPLPLSPEGCECVAYALSDDKTWLAYLAKKEDEDTFFSVGAVNIKDIAPGTYREPVEIEGGEASIPSIFWQTE